MKLEKMQVLKCADCSHVLEVVAAGPCECEMQCCGKPMKLMDEKSKDGAGEKHMPIVEKEGDGIKVKVGSVPHPMEEKHWIQLIEVITKDGFVIRKDLNPGDKPEAVFNVAQDNVKAVREHCNIHGLWAI